MTIEKLSTFKAYLESIKSEVDRQDDISKAVQEAARQRVPMMREGSTNRWYKLIPVGSAILGLTSLPGQAAGGLLGTVYGSLKALVNRGSWKEDIIQGAKQGAKIGNFARYVYRYGKVKSGVLEQKELVQRLGQQPPPNGILTKTNLRLAFPLNIKTASMFEIMRDYCRKIGSQISPEELTSLINTGEKIVRAIKQADDVNNITVDGHRVTANKYTVRAICWYLMAKAGFTGKIDEAGREIYDPDLLVRRGTLVIKDEDQKIYQFLRSANETYGRVSTHFCERAPASGTGTLFKEGGIVSGVSGLFRKRPIQYGIEDYGKKFPGQKGALLFGAIKGKDGRNELFLKFEEVGVPNFITFCRGDYRYNWSFVLGMKTRAMSRTIEHGINLIKSKIKKSSDGELIHRESFKGGIPKEVVYKPFQNVLYEIMAKIEQQINRDLQGLNLSREEKNQIKALKRGIQDAVKEILDDCDTYGMYKVEKYISLLRESDFFTQGKGIEDENNEILNQLDFIQETIQSFKEQYGSQNYLQKGAEVYVKTEADRQST